MKQPFLSKVLSLSIIVVVSVCSKRAFAAQAPVPSFSTVTISGLDLIVTGSGGTAGGTYYVLTATNVALSPISLWARIATNSFAPDGTFSNSIPLNPIVPHNF